MWSRNFKFLLIYSHIKNLQVFIGAFSQISTGKIWLCSQCGSWEKFPYLGSSLGSAQTSSWQILMQFGASIITMSGITSGIQAVSTTGLSRMAQSSNLHMGWNIMIRAKSSQWSSSLSASTMQLATSREAMRKKSSKAWERSNFEQARVRARAHR